VRLSALKGDGYYGKGTIYLDGELYQIDLSGEDRLVPAVIFEKSGLAQGMHTLVFMNGSFITWTGSMSADRRLPCLRRRM
jgi:hypothetical protein